MGFLNLGPAEILAIFGAISAAITLLYLLDRSRRKIVVAALQFWQPAVRPQQQHRRKRITQPLSLLLQLLALLALILAIAQPRWDFSGFKPRHHVLILDRSGISAAQQDGKLALDHSKQLLLEYLQRLPVGDRVMLIRADGAPTAVSGWTENRSILGDSIRQTEPGFTALRLRPALDLADSALKNSSVRPGEIVFAGALQVLDGKGLRLPENFRILQPPPPIENTGIRRVVLTRGDAVGLPWQMSVTLGHRGTTPSRGTLRVSLGKALIADRGLAIAPDTEQQVVFPLAIRQSGEVRVWWDRVDSLASDNDAILEIPGRPVRRLVVFTANPAAWNPLLKPLTGFEIQLKTPESLTAKPDADVAILDGVSAQAGPLEIPSLVLTTTAAETGDIKSWSGDHPVTRGLQSLKLPVVAAGPLRSAPGDVVLAKLSAEGAADRPIVVVRDGGPRRIEAGLALISKELRGQVATPLLLANCLSWLTPERAESSDTRVTTVGGFSLPVDPSANPADIEVTDGNGPMPFSLRRGQLELFAGQPTLLRVKSGKTETAVSLTLPDTGAPTWTPEESTKRGLPSVTASLNGPSEIWPWLALAAIALLLADWILFGKSKFAAKPVSAEGLA